MTTEEAGMTSGTPAPVIATFLPSAVEVVEPLALALVALYTWLRRGVGSGST